MMRILGVALLTLALAGCGGKDKAALDMRNLFGEWEHVATMHGYFDNYDACLDIAKVLTAKWGREYRCRGQI